MFLRLDFERRECNRSDLQNKWQSCYVYINLFHDLFLSSLPVARVFTSEPEPYAIVIEIGELIDVCTPPFDTSLSGYTCNFHSYPISSEINIKPNFCFHPRSSIRSFLKITYKPSQINLSTTCHTHEGAIEKSLSAALTTSRLSIFASLWMFFHPHPPSFRCGGLYIYVLPPRSYIPATQISHSPNPRITHFFLVFIALCLSQPPIHPKTDSCVFRSFPCPFSIPHDSPPPQHPGETWDILISNRGGGDGDENNKNIIQTTEYKPNISPNTTHYLLLSSFRVPPLPHSSPHLSQHPSTETQPNPSHPINLYNPRSKSKLKSKKTNF